MEENIIIVLISVTLGWGLAQFTSIVKDFWNSRKLKAGLVQELQDIDNQLERVIMIHARQLQFLGNRAMEPTTSLPIYNMFFKQYYKDTLSRLNREQRLSYQVIHATVDALNTKNQDLGRYFEGAYKEIKDTHDANAISRSIDLWGDRVIVCYKTARDLRWHVRYHLNNSRKPSFDLMGPMHKSFLKFIQELDLEVKSIIEAGRRMKKEDFKKSIE